MKRIVLLVLIMALMLMLAACGGNDEETESESNSAEETAGQVDSQPSDQTADEKTRLDDSKLAVPVQLAVGSLNLDNTESAVDAALAADLLPLWQAYQSLSTSDTAAEMELNAVLNQIQDTMNPEQIQAIAEMKLTEESVDAIFEELGIQLRGSGGPGGGGAGGSGFPAGAPGGGVPGGGRPGGGPGGLSPEASQTAIAERFGEGVDFAAVMRERAAMNTLIRTLQVKTGEIDESQLRAGPGRFMETISEASGVLLETLEAGIADGETTLAEVISANGGDLDAAETALREMFADFPELEDADIEQRVTDFLGL